MHSIPMYNLYGSTCEAIQHEMMMSVRSCACFLQDPEPDTESLVVGVLNAFVTQDLQEYMSVSQPCLHSRQHVINLTQVTAVMQHMGHLDAVNVMTNGRQEHLSSSVYNNQPLECKSI